MNACHSLLVLESPLNLMSLLNFITLTGGFPVVWP
jgi:hypothetical protein